VLLVLGLTGNSSDEPSTTTTGTSAQKPAKKKKAASEPAKKKVARRPRSVKLRIVPASPTYVCLDKGIGTPVVYEGTLAGPKSWKARHLRVNLGRRAVRITKNGKLVHVPPGSDPIGFDFRPTRTRELAIGQRPCA
jgi:hypothetical protein